MSRYRVVPRAFITNSPPVLWGPGRYAWGDVYDWWLRANSEPTDDASIPKGHAEGITNEGLATAFDRLAVWQRNNA